jgi:hypothetical protein
VEDDRAAQVFVLVAHALQADRDLRERRQRIEPALGFEVAQAVRVRERRCDELLPQHAVLDPREVGAEYELGIGRKHREIFDAGGARDIRMNGRGRTERGRGAAPVP